MPWTILLFACHTFDMQTKPNQRNYKFTYPINLKAISRLGMAIALGLAVNACAGEDPKTEDSTQTGGEAGSTESATQGVKKDTAQNDSTGGGDGNKDPGCSDIQWGSSLKVGGIIPKSRSRGYVDTDGDHQADGEVREVGMCELHQLKAKCGLIMTGWYGCKGCGPEFEYVGQRMQELRDANIAVYAIYSELEPDKGIELMKKYFGSRPDMYSNSSEIEFEFAPLKILVNLKTMEILKVDGTRNGNPEVFEVEEAIEACKKL